MFLKVLKRIIEIGYVCFSNIATDGRESIIIANDWCILDLEVRN